MLKPISLTVLLAFPTVAAAQWFHESSGGAFDDAALQIAVTTGGGYTFGVRCRTADDLELIYVTPEVLTGADAGALNALSPELLVRVDDNPAHELRAFVDLAGLFAGFQTMSPEGLAAEMAAATQRIAVAGRLAGQMFHEHEFGVAGSGRAITAALEGCGIPAS